MDRRITLALGLTATLAIAACGGGAASPAAPTSGPTQAPPATSEPQSAPPASACAPSTAAATVTASMRGRAFAPATITAKVGDVIGWTNADSVPHTATLTDDPACTTDNLGEGESGALSFAVPGTYAFFCKIHPDMIGTIEVTG
jgi:plastocyanin